MKVLFLIAVVTILAQIVEMKKKGPHGKGSVSKALMEEAEDLQENLEDLREDLAECLGLEETPERGYEKLQGAIMNNLGAVSDHVLKKRIRVMKKHIGKLTRKLDECRAIQAAAAAAAQAAADAVARIGGVTTDDTITEDMTTESPVP